MVESRVTIRLRLDVAAKWKVIEITSDRSSGALVNEVMWVIRGGFSIFHQQSLNRQLWNPSMSL